MSSAVVVFIALCGLLVAGKFVRIKVPLLQRLYLPSSVIGGAIGLVVMSIAGDAIDPEIPGAMRRVPGFLINVVFATLFLGVPIPNFRRVVSLAFPQLVLGQIMAWGQYVVGLGLAGFVLSRLFGVPPCFGNLIEIGFEGGHGTVGGMTESFLAAGGSDGAALGFTVATAGMIVGIVVGMALVNWAQGKGIVKEVVPFERRRWRERLAEDLDRNWEVLAEPIQTVMRKVGMDHPYERLKELTRGRRVNAEIMRDFVKALPLPKDDKARLMKLTPSTYIGLAEKLARLA